VARKKDGKDLFEKYFHEEYQDRWPHLYHAMQADRQRYISITQDPELTYKALIGLTDHPAEGYHIDPASMEAVLALDIQKGDRVWDACAAPGGKALIILRILAGSGMLTVSDISSSRAHRLRRNLEQFGIYKNYEVNIGDMIEMQCPVFDKILLDAPCSSERHWIEKDMLDDWRVGRTRHLSVRQHALLCRAWDVLKPGGLLVYSTCSISKKENDGVIKQFLKKRNAVVKPSYHAEKSEYGTMILPDTHMGQGPIYFCVLEKPTI
tara:strand:+ start:498 stop:1292 length:795 start_codon:yes stop_codon:yes gene_type:complete